MKMATFTDFRKKALDIITKAEQGETVVIIRHGKPAAETVFFSGKPGNTPAWNQKAVQLQFQGSDLFSAILEDREDSQSKSPLIHPLLPKEMCKRQQ